MKLTFLFGKWASALHGKFDIDTLYEGRGLTGSESDFFNTARALAERGHHVTVMCDAVRPSDGAAKLGGACVRQIEVQPTPDDSDVYLCWNEPDLLRTVPTTAIKVLKQELNDFGYCQPGYQDIADVFAFISPVQMEYLLQLHPEIPREKAIITYNSTNLEFFDKTIIQRRPKRFVYCSSPDRGLHQLIMIWPRIRQLVPDAELHIYYEFDRWHAKARSYKNALGMRARYLHECFERIGKNGEHGVFVRGNVSNKAMAEELLKASGLIYTCEPVSFTEGFSISILDACAAGCLPIISDVDSIGQLYGSVATVIPGKPSDHHDEWVQAVVAHARMSEAELEPERQKVRDFAKKFSRQHFAQLWEDFLLKLIKDRSRLPDTFERANSTPIQTALSKPHDRVGLWLGARPYEPLHDKVIRTLTKAGLTILCKPEYQRDIEGIKWGDYEPAIYNTYASDVFISCDEYWSFAFKHIENHRKIYWLKTTPGVPPANAADTIRNVDVFVCQNEEIRQLLQKEHSWIDPVRMELFQTVEWPSLIDRLIERKDGQ